MDLKFWAALAVGKTISTIIKLKGGGATAAPGYYALKVDPNLIPKLTKNLDQNIVVSGTNGKTTTSRLISDILSQNHKIIHNRQGSNLTRGIASTLLKNYPLKQGAVGLWEVDEATLADAISATNPQIIVLLNLFRDQLDRYGEVNTLHSKWQKIVSTLPKETTLILNADDPGITYLAKFAKCKVIFFGIEDKKIDLPQVAAVADTKYCPNCSEKLIFKVQYSSHLGHYQCPSCSFSRPKPQIYASNLDFEPDFSTKLQISIHKRTLSASYQLPGLFNVYNVLAAVSVANSFDLEDDNLTSPISNFSGAFGRFQKINIQNKQILIFLVKNPTGANEVLRTLATKNNLTILAILNDNFADGRDVSWIWDTNWEILVDKVKSVNIAGTRGWDLANRVKYAGFKLDKNSVYTDIYYSLQKSLDNLSNNNTLIVLPTYTALLKIQQSLNKMGTNLKWHKD